MRDYNNRMLNLTREGLDCIELDAYIDIDKSLDDVMQEIQMAYEYHSLPSDATAIFNMREFRSDVFRFMDEQDFEEYLLDRYPDEGIDFAS